MSLNRFAYNRENPLWQIIEFMQRNGSATVKDLEDLLGVTTTAVRQHLTSLQAEGYIERRRESTGVGRPHHVYSVTGKVQELFACHCDDLALTLLEEVFKLEGKERVALLLERVGERLAGRYASSIRSGALQDRVQELADALYSQGVLTEVISQDDETIVLHTYNCPYHELAQEHREVCEMDENMMQRVLGSDVNLSRCMMDGEGRCSFVVSTATQGASVPQQHAS